MPPSPEPTRAEAARHMADDNREPDDDAQEPTKVDLKQVLAQEGNWEAVARHLAYKMDEREADNARFRRRNRELRDLLPAEGAIVIPPEKAEEFRRFTADLEAAGITDAAALKSHLDAAQANAARVAEAEREAELARVAAAAGIENVAALAAVFSNGEAFEVEGEGEDAKVYVKPPDGERAGLEAYLDADPRRAALKPALFAATTKAEPTRSGGVAFVSQQPGSPQNGGRPPAPPKPADAEQIAQQKRGRTEYAAAF